jgi:hypothetical protein
MNSARTPVRETFMSGGSMIWAARSAWHCQCRLYRGWWFLLTLGNLALM